MRTGRRLGPGFQGPSASRAERSACSGARAREQQCSIEAVAERFAKPLSKPRCEPVIEDFRESAHETAIGSAALEEDADQPVDCPGSILNDRFSDGISPAGMFHHDRSEDPEVRRRCSLHPGYDLARGIREALEDLSCHRAVGDPAVPGPQALPDGLQPKVGPAALVGDRKTIAANDDRLAGDAGEANAPGADDDDTSILA